VGLDLLDGNWRFSSGGTPKQISEVITGTEQITLEAVHQLQNNND